MNETIYFIAILALYASALIYFPKLVDVLEQRKIMNRNSLVCRKVVIAIGILLVILSTMVITGGEPNDTNPFLIAINFIFVFIATMFAATPNT